MALGLKLSSKKVFSMLLEIYLISERLPLLIFLPVISSSYIPEFLHVGHICDCIRLWVAQKGRTRTVCVLCPKDLCYKKLSTVKLHNQDIRNIRTMVVWAALIALNNKITNSSTLQLRIYKGKWILMKNIEQFNPEGILNL